MSASPDIINRIFWVKCSPAIVPTELQGLKTKGPAVFGNTSGPLESKSLPTRGFVPRPRQPRKRGESAVFSTGRPCPIRGRSRAIFAAGANFGASDFRAPEASLACDGYPLP